MSICYKHPFTVMYRGGLPGPYLNITLVDPYAEKSLKVSALIDTGASDCAFPADFALMLGRNLQAGKEKKFLQGLEKPLPTLISCKSK